MKFLSPEVLAIDHIRRIERRLSACSGADLYMWEQIVASRWRRLHANIPASQLKEATRLADDLPNQIGLLKRSSRQESRVSYVTKSKGLYRNRYR